MRGAYAPYDAWRYHLVERMESMFILMHLGCEPFRNSLYLFLCWLQVLMLTAIASTLGTMVRVSASEQSETLNSNLARGIPSDRRRHLRPVRGLGAVSKCAGRRVSIQG